MTIHFLRHATFLLQAGKTKILVDPMLSERGAMDPVKNVSTEIRIPMTDLPITKQEIVKELESINAVIITHTHRDHWDAEAQSLIAKGMPLIIQPEDQEAIRQQGFTNLVPVELSITYNDLKITRTGGQHGTGEIGKLMGKVSGFVIERNHKKLYVAGDTIWCDEVDNAIKTHHPDFIIVNAGAAQFLQGGPITMTADDVMKVCQAAPFAKVIAVHMDTVNHCFLKKRDLKEALTRNNMISRCIIPDDGEVLQLL